MTEDEMLGLHHQRDGREFEQALGVGDEQVINQPDVLPSMGWQRV